MTTAIVVGASLLSLAGWLRMLMARDVNARNPVRRCDKPGAA
jgi:hypothetical protein